MACFSDESEQQGYPIGQESENPGQGGVVEE